MQVFTCWIVGEGSLALQCAEVLLRRGHSLRGIVSPDAGHAAWAAERGLRWAPTSDLAAALGEAPFDLLFSVANTAVLPAAVLRMPRVRAINYHDAPLPAYAGMHASSWALIHDEPRHGISWHAMVEQIDGGEIYYQCTFDLAPDETALTLNAKCYAAAIEGFDHLMQALAAGTLRGQAQDAARRSYFGLHRRPRAAGLLAWSQPARALAALARGLEFGPYLNPLGRVKVRVGADEVLAVASVEVTEGTGAPGTVLAVGRDEVTVAVVDGAVRLRGWAALAGSPRAPGLAVGDVLPEWPEEALARLSAANERAARHEGYWIGRLGEVQPVAAPYGGGAGERRVIRSDIDAAEVVGMDRVDACCVAFALYLGRFHGVTELDVGYRGPERSDGWDSVFAPLVGWRVAVRAEASFAEALREGAASLAELRRRGTYARDLVSRVPALVAAPRLRELVFPVAVIVGAAALPEGTALALVLGDAPAWLYDASRISADEVARVAAQYRTLLTGLLAEPTRPCGQIEVVPADERAQLDRWNATTRAYPRGVRVHDLLARQAARTPDAPAVTFAEETWTYGEFNARVNQLAQHLRSLGVGPERLVGVCMPRSNHMITAMFAILRAGGAYVPLDPGLPRERLAFMREDAGVAVVVGTRAALAWLPDAARGVALDELELSAYPDVDPAVALTDENLIYAIFTSGSTGKPKAAMNSHAGVFNRLMWGQEAFPLTAADRVLQKTPIGFDVSVYEVFWPLLVGAHLVVARPDGHKDAGYLASIIASARITSIHFVPSMLQIFLAHHDFSGCGSLRQVFCSGEALPAALQRRFFECIDAALHNLYGPTEAAVEATAWTCRRDDERSWVPIGRPIANVQVHILDAALRPVPIGACGELCIGGVGVARGYCNREALTAERFVVDPRDPNGRLYRTGDRARHASDGSIEYLGRLDFQVKIRGVRIEPGEIEAALMALPAVREAVVVARDDGGGERRLVAYLTGRGLPTPTVGDLRAALLATLPEAMIPAVFMWLPALPLLASGKVDRGQLPAPDAGRRDVGAYVAPQTAVERALCEIWAALLGVERVGVEDNFFELGGDSIVALQVVARARQAGWRIALKMLFKGQTVARVAAEAEPVAELPAAVAAAEGSVPLTPIQRWFFDLPLHAREHWNQDVHLEAAGPVDPRQLATALAAIGDHHDALRMRYVQGAHGWTQTYAPPGQPAPLQMLMAPAHGDLETWLGPAVQQAQASLDLARGPLWRALLVVRDGAPDRLVLVAHHLVVDGVSWRVLIEDLQRALAQVAAGRPVALPAKTTSYRAWSERLQAHVEDPTYWAEALACPPALAAAAVPDREGEARDAVVRLGADETRALLAAVPARHGTRINDALLTALALALRDWTGQARGRIDLEGHGREDMFEGIDVSRTVGWFTSISPVVLDVTGVAEPEAGLRRIQAGLRAAPHRGVGYGVLRHLRGALPAAPACGISFNYLGQFDASPGATLRIVEDAGRAASRRAPGDVRPHTLEVEGRILGDCLEVKWRHNPRVHATASIAALARGFLTHLRRLIARATGAEREEVLALAPAQRDMLAHVRRAPHSGAYVLQWTAVFAGAVDEGALRRAWEVVIQRHPIFRAAFVRRGGEDVQVIRAAARLEWVAEDWSGLADEEQEARLAARLGAERVAGLGVDGSPPLRVHWLTLGPRRRRLVWTHHHLLADGWSFVGLLREVASVYMALEAGEVPAAPAVHGFAEYVDWLGRQDQAAAQAHWRRALAGVVGSSSRLFGPESGPMAHERGGEPGEWYGEEALVLSEAASAGLQRAAQACRVTASTLVQAAWGLLLAARTGARDVVFGVTQAGRAAELAGAAEIQGPMIVTLPVRATIDPDMALVSWLGRLQAQQAEANTFAYVSAAQVAGWCGEAGLFDTCVRFQNFPRDPTQARWGGLEIAEARWIDRWHHAISLAVVPDRRWRLCASHSRAHLDGEAMRGWLRDLRTLLEEFVRDAWCRLGALLGRISAEPARWTRAAGAVQAAVAC